VALNIKNQIIFYKVISHWNNSPWVDMYDAPVGYIILISSQTVFAFSMIYSLMLHAYWRSNIYQGYILWLYSTVAMIWLKNSSLGIKQQSLTQNENRMSY
jgi:hypothetical protein